LLELSLHDYETNLVLSYAHSNNSQIFQYISSIKDQDHYPIEMFYNDKPASTDSDNVQIFNEYFYSVFSCSDPPTTGVDLDTVSTSDDVVVSEPDVFDMLTY